MISLAMPKKVATQKARKFTVRRNAATGQFIVGRAASVKISRVEGLILSQDLKDTFRFFDEKGLSNTARRSALVGKYGKKGR
jgi:hypothetical protein